MESLTKQNNSPTYSSDYDDGDGLRERPREHSASETVYPHQISDNAL